MAKKILVVLDPGHKPGYNKGAVSGYYEGDKMYTLSEYEKKALESYGIDVILTRARDKDMELYARGQVAVKKAKGYDVVVFISNHSNACNGKAVGVVVYRSLYLPKSEDLGKKLAEAVVKVMKPTTEVTYSRGVATRQGNKGDYYGVIRGAVSGVKSIADAVKGPVDYAFIVEHGFHDNVKECTFLNSNANLKKIAEAESKVIADYFGIKKPTATTTTSSTTTFKVRVKIENLHVRKGPGSSYASTGYCKPGTYTIVESKTSGGYTWGRLKSGAGWIALKYTERV